MWMSETQMIQADLTAQRATIERLENEIRLKDRRIMQLLVERDNLRDQLDNSSNLK